MCFPKWTFPFTVSLLLLCFLKHPAMCAGCHFPLHAVKNKKKEPFKALHYKNGTFIATERSWTWTSLNHYKMTTNRQRTSGCWAGTRKDSKKKKKPVPQHLHWSGIKKKSVIITATPSILATIRTIIIIQP